MKTFEGGSNSPEKKSSYPANGGLAAIANGQYKATLHAPLDIMPGYLARRMHQLATAVFAQEMSEYDLTPVQYAVLAIVGKFPNTDQVSCAQAVGIDRTTIVGVVDRLERKELILRAISAKDKRARVLNVTEKGGQLLVQLQSAVARVNDRLLEPFAQGEGLFFREQILKFITYHEKLGVDGSEAA